MIIDIEKILKAKILIVGDNSVSILSIEKLLRVSGYFNIRTSTDLREILQLFKDYQPDLILLDLQMPKFNGYQVIEQLNKVKEDEYLSLIVITANNDQVTRLKALTMGAKDFISKPFDYTEVLIRVRTMLELHCLHNEINEFNKM